jgi:hypothetical protein
MVGLMALAFNTIQMVLDTKVCGKKIYKLVNNYFNFLKAWVRKRILARWGLL